MTDSEFIQQSIESNLIYCGSMMEFAYSLGFSFLEKNKDIEEEVYRFYTRFKKQILKTINIANENISKELLESNILYTEYMIPLYKLGEELTGKKADIEVIKALMNLVPGNIEVNNDMLQEVNNINNNTLKLLKEYIDFLTYLANQISKLNLFIFKYNMYVDDVKKRAVFYYENLYRIINKEIVTVIMIDRNINNIKNIMERNSLFINGFVNQSEEDVIMQARNFEVAFNELDLNINDNLNIEEIKKIYNSTISLTDSFIYFIEALIRQLLNKKIQFIVGPTYLDICLRAANDFKYNLKLMINSTKK